MQTSSLSTLAQRQRAVAMVLALTANTALAPQAYERQLLARFECGDLSLDHLSDLMEQSVYQLLYHSRATQPMREADLQELLESARAHNAAHGITGLLLYSQGHFVQVLEGDRAVVQALFARIRHDPRHAQVVRVSEGQGPRRFAQWSMEYKPVAGPELQQALMAVQVQWPFRVPNVDDPHLQALVGAFV